MIGGGAKVILAVTNGEAMSAASGGLAANGTAKGLTKKAMAPARIAAFRIHASSSAVIIVTRVLGEAVWSLCWVSRPLTPGIQIPITARATEWQLTYERKPSGS